MSTAIEVSALTMSYGDREVLQAASTSRSPAARSSASSARTAPARPPRSRSSRASGSGPAATVSVLGMDPQAQPTRLRERIGIVLQECGFPRQARVAELIDCWRAYYRKPARDLEDLLKVVELTEDRNVQVRRLSGGQRRRLDLALALAGRPGPDLPRRADDRLRPGVAAALLGGDREPPHARQDDRAHHPLPGRGGAAGRPGGDPAATAASRSPARCGTSPGRPGVPTRITFTAPQRLRDGDLAVPAGLDVDGHGRAGGLPDAAPLRQRALRELLAWAAENDLGDLDDLSVDDPHPGGRLPPARRRRRSMSRVVSLAARQALMEQRSFWRSAEYALFTFALPLALLLLIGSTTANGDLPGTHVEGQMIFVPSIIAFGVIVAAYVNLGAKLATLGTTACSSGSGPPRCRPARTCPACSARPPPPRSRSPPASSPSAGSSSTRSRGPAACRRSPAASSSASSASAPSASRSARSPAAPSRPRRSPTPATCRSRSCRASSTPRSASRAGCTAVVAVLPGPRPRPDPRAGLHPGRARLPGRPVRPPRLDRGRLRVRRLAIPLALRSTSVMSNGPCLRLARPRCPWPVSRRSARPGCVPA